MSNKNNRSDQASDEQLVTEARANSQGFGKLFDRYYPEIFGYVVKRVGDTAIAQDIVSEVFFKAYDKLWQFKWRKLPFSAWLYRIAGNEIANYYRKNKYHAVSLDALVHQGFEPMDEKILEQELIVAQEALDREQDVLRMRKLLASLDPKYQEVLALKYFEDKKLHEIAEITGKNLGTVKSLVSRGVAFLRVQMQADDEPHTTLLSAGEEAV